jgi:hypothetical protein
MRIIISASKIHNTYYEVRKLPGGWDYCVYAIILPTWTAVFLDAREESDELLTELAVDIPKSNPTRLGHNNQYRHILADLLEIGAV